MKVASKRNLDGKIWSALSCYTWLIQCDLSDQSSLQATTLACEFTHSSPKIAVGGSQGFCEKKKKRARG